MPHKSWKDYEQYIQILVKQTAHEHRWFYIELPLQINYPTVETQMKVMPTALFESPDPGQQNCSQS